MSAAARVAAAYENALEEQKSPEQFRLVFSVIHAAEAAEFALLATGNPQDAHRWMQRAAHEAYLAVRPVEALPGEAGATAIDAARRDYATLLRAYGEHDEVVLGHPLDCFEQK
jgi:hypothetical protein